MISVTVKKLWNGYVSLRTNWIKIGIEKDGLAVIYRNQTMEIPKSALEKSLQFKPSQYIKSKYNGEVYGLHDILWIPEDDRQGNLFKGEKK